MTEHFVTESHTLQTDVQTLISGVRCLKKDDHNLVCVFIIIFHIG